MNANRFVRFRVRWTDKALWKIARHGVTPQQVNEALNGYRYYPTSGTKTTLIGRAEGRVLFIVLARSRKREGYIEIVTARPATHAEKRSFHRRGKVTR